MLQLPVASWYRLGIQLGVAKDDLDVIEQNYLRDIRMCRLKMFSTWLQSDTSATYEKLIKALSEIDETSLAKELCGKYGMLVSTFISQFAINLVVTYFMLLFLCIPYCSVNHSRHELASFPNPY